MKIFKGFIDGVDKSVTFVRNNIQKSSDRIDGKIWSAKSARIAFVAFLAGLLVLFVYGIIRNSNEESPVNNFKSEITPKLPISQGVGSPNFDKSELDGYKSNLDSLISGNKTLDRDIPMPDSVANSSSGGSSGGVPNKFECNELLQGLKNGDTLNDTQKGDLTKCMDSNVLPMSEDQKAALKQALNDSTLTPEARKLLAAYAENPNSLSEEDRKNIKGLMSSDPDIKNLAMGALTPGLSAEEKKNAIGALDSALQGDKSGIKNVSDIIEKGKVLAEEASKKWSMPSFGSLKKEEKTGPATNIAKYAGARDLDNEIASNDEKISRNSSAIKTLSDKIKNELSKPEDQRGPLDSSYSQMATLSKEQSELKKANEQKKLQLTQMATEMNSDLAIIKSGMRTRNSTSGVGVFEDVPEQNNAEIVDLSEDELRLLRLLESKEDRFKRKRKNIVADGKGGESKLVVADFFNQGEVQLNPAVRLLADLDDDIWIGDKNFADTTVIARLRQDAIELDSGRVVLYSGGLLFGKISSINKGIDTATVIFDRAQVGAKIVKIKISTQVKGRIKETRGETLTAAAITELAGSISDGIKEQADNDLGSIANPTIVDKINSSTTGAIGSVFNKAAQMIAEDLQNSQRIFYSRRGTKLILNP